VTLEVGTQPEETKVTGEKELVQTEICARECVITLDRSRLIDIEVRQASLTIAE
jgi:hypothetical protein